MSKHLVKYAIKLGEFDLQYIPRPTINGQALENFIVEYYFKGLIQIFKSPPLTTTFFVELEALVE